ncbi:TPA: cadmium resistance transporter [Streptococcus suis]|nr:cadmium resistance transporter [Streptococcus suis]
MSSLIPISFNNCSLIAFIAFSCTNNNSSLSAFASNFSSNLLTDSCLLTFLVMIYLLVFSAQKLAQVPSVGETLEKYSRWFIAVVYLGLGMYILIENNSFDMLWAVLG